LGHDPHVFLPAFEKKDLGQKDLSKLGAGFDEEVFISGFRYDAPLKQGR